MTREFGTVCVDCRMSSWHRDAFLGFFGRQEEGRGQWGRGRSQEKGRREGRDCVGVRQMGWEGRGGEQHVGPEENI